MRKLSIVFITTFIALQITFLCLILWGPEQYVNIFEFVSVVNAFLFSLLFICKSKSVVLTEIALLFTMLADLFLEIIKPMNQLVAMILFSVVQLAYFARLFMEIQSKKWKIINIVARIIIIIIAELVAYLVVKEKLDLLSIVAMFYISNLLLNIILAFAEFKKSPFLAIGLLLFLGCDIIVGLQVSIGTYFYVSTDSILYKIAFCPVNITWICYLPSQTLLALSILNYNKNTFIKFNKRQKDKFKQVA